MKCHQILVVENDLLLRQMLSRELSRRNYITYFAKSGEEGIEKLSKLPVDLILVELSLPGMNGWQFIEHQKSNSRTSKIPSLIYSRSIAPRSSPGLTRRHSVKSESLDELMESVAKICDQDQGLNEYAPEIKRITLPRKIQPKVPQKRKTS